MGLVLIVFGLPAGAWLIAGGNRILAVLSPYHTGITPNFSTQKNRIFDGTNHKNAGNAGIKNREAYERFLTGVKRMVAEKEDERKTAPERFKNDLKFQEIIADLKKQNGANTPG